MEGSSGRAQAASSDPLARRVEQVLSLSLPLSLSPSLPLSLSPSLSLCLSLYLAGDGLSESFDREELALLTKPYLVHPESARKSG